MLMNTFETSKTSEELKFAPRLSTEKIIGTMNSVL
jgi:hypothetical protein